MAENIEKSNTSKKMEIKYEGWNEAASNLYDRQKKIDNVKEKILDNIKLNRAFYTVNGKQISPNSKIIRNAGDYDIIMVRCGATPVWKNTVRKGAYAPLDILNDLENKLNEGFFESDINKYLDKKRKSTSDSYSMDSKK